MLGGAADGLDPVALIDDLAIRHPWSAPCLVCRALRLNARVAPYSGLCDVDRRAQRRDAVELDHVRDRHADAAVRGCRAERPELVGAVDAGTVVDAHPAGLDR